jgi:hypothetical protein
MIVDKGKLVVRTLLAALVLVLTSVAIAARQVEPTSASGGAPGNRGVSISEWTAIAVSALAVIAAVLIATYEGRRAREHARLSVRPCLDFHFLATEGRLEMKNAGLGPAILVSLSVGTPDVREAHVCKEQWASVEADLKLGKAACFTFLDRFVLAPQEKVTILTINNWGSCDADTFMARLHVVARYKSLYEEAFEDEY